MSSTRLQGINRMKKMVNSSGSTYDWTSCFRVLLLLPVLFILGCDQLFSPSENKDQSSLVAQVGKSRLTEQDLENMFGVNFYGEDSVRAIKTYIRRWVKEELIKKEAEKELNSDSEIQRMVEDYRKSLLIHKFEQEMAQAKLDSSISQRDIAQQYQKNKASFILAEPIFAIRWILITNANISVDELEDHWVNNEKSTEEKWGKLAELYANNYNLDPGIWWGKTELLSLLPVERHDFLDRTGEVIRKPIGEDDTLLVDIIEVKNQGELAPISFVEDDIKSYILHQRKEAFLRDYRENLYEKAVNNNTVKINLK